MGRHVVRLQAGQGNSQWQAIVAAPLTGADPIVIWSGATPNDPSDGKESVPAIDVTEPDADGTVTVLVGERRADIQLCGRPTLLAPQVVLAKDLALRSVRMQRLTRAERDKAEAVDAVVATGAQPTPLGRILQTTGASSAIGSPSALTDGNAETVWSEARPGEGRGEFAVMRSPAELSIRSLSLQVRPAQSQVPDGVAPKSFYLAADGRLFHVTLPDDAWKHPGSRYEIKLNNPLKTSCLALVLDDASVGADASKAAVSVAELTAYSEFDGSTDLAGLVGALAGGGERAQAAAALLQRMGPEARSAVISAFDKLDDAGRALAMAVIDASPCSQSAPLYARLLTSKNAIEKSHSRDRIQRCGRASSEALVGVLSSSDAELVLAAATELASVAPDLAIEKLTARLGSSDPKVLRAIRAAIAHAASQARSGQALERVLQDGSLSAPVALNLLRASGEGIAKFPQASSALFHKIALSGGDVPTRYLLCDPASRLVRTGDAFAISFLGERIAKDADPMVRARAAEVSVGLAPVQSTLISALNDPHVRVRDAAVIALSGQTGALPNLANRLQTDEWTFVRMHAAESIGAAGASKEADDALGHALDHDISPMVRGRVASAIGNRAVQRLAPMLRARVEDADESLDVRMRATYSLGQVCDASSLSLLTTLAKRAEDPFGTDMARNIGIRAIAALGRLHPSDLADRLKPILSSERAPNDAKAAARAAIAETQVCK
jgi:hypothetical protein